MGNPQPNPGGNVYHRNLPDDLHEAWNAVVRRVNDERANPPEDTDCDPLDAIDEVEEDHIWTKQDIEDLRSAVDEMCPFSWTEDLEYWKDSIISEIEDSLDREYGGWGDEGECCEEECWYECPNARGHGSERRDEYYLGRWYNSLIFYTTHEVDTCDPESPLEVRGHYPDCDHGPFVMSEIPEGYYDCVSQANSIKSQAVVAANNAIFFKMGAFPFGAQRDHYDEVVIPPLEAKRDAAEEARDDACNQDPPNPSACEAAQAYLDQCQEDLDAATAQRDYYADQYDTRLEMAQGFAEDCEAYLDSYHSQLSACIGMLNGTQQGLIIRLWELAEGNTAPYWDDVYSLENYKDRKLQYYNCRPTWGSKMREDDPCGGQPIAPISGRAIGLGFSSMLHYGYIDIHRPAGECWWPWPPPHWYPVEEQNTCYSCNYPNSPPGCWSSFCNESPCSPADYAAMYTEWWFCIVHPESHEPVCP